MSKADLRCAIYTRKSHEEGLDQSFNSLDAQREAGIDYIRSQKHEGWQFIDKRYDDGGFTGGNTDRPALQELLKDIKHGMIDVLVVYKVDRLSRSLHDFAQIIKIFEEHQVCFVSVTQQFNTTTSIGRLTLNMLLSFAQFEREVTGERIRDKLAATKKKGLWVTGQPPLGYEAVDRQLIAIAEEADLVKKIYRGYLKNTSLIELADQLNAKKHTTKHWLSSRNKWHGGRKLTPKYLYRVLTNPLYIGKITHKDKVWPGQHLPIINQILWDKVQSAMDPQQRQTRHRWTHPHLLKGKLRTHEDFAMSPSTVHRPGKTKGQKRLVRYYVSQKAIRLGYKNCDIKTINAGHLEELIRALMLDYLRQHESFDQLDHQPSQIRDYWLREMIDQITLAPDQLTLKLNMKQIQACKNNETWNVDNKQQNCSISTCLYQPDIEYRGKIVIMTLTMQIKRLDGKRMLLSPDGHDLFMPAEPKPKEHICTAIGRAYDWRRLLAKDQLNLARLAKQQNVSVSQIKKLLPLINLGPSILRRALTGELPPSLTLKHLLDASKFLDWHRQLTYLGLPHDGSSTATHQA